MKLFNDLSQKVGHVKNLRIKLRLIYRIYRKHALLTLY